MAQKKPVDLNLGRPLPPAPAEKHTVCGCVWRALSFIGAAVTFVRNLFCNLIFLSLIFLVWVGIEFASNLGETAIEIIDAQLLEPPREKPGLISFNLSGSISEMPFSRDDVEVLSRKLNNSLIGAHSHSIFEIEDALDLASSDEDIRECFINLSNVTSLTLPLARRLGRAIDSFQAEGKTVTVFANNYGQMAYLVASHADKIVLDPLGKIDLKGFALNNLYYKGLIERFQITPYVFRAGEFKSAVEPYLRQDMSDEVREEHQRLVDEVWRVYLEQFDCREDIARNIDRLLSDPEFYLASLEARQGDFAAIARDFRLIDTSEPLRELLLEFAGTYGHASRSVFRPNSIEYLDYLNFYATPTEKSAKRFAVVYGIGPIVNSTTRPTDFSPNNLVPVLDSIAIDKRIEGVIFYINSGGGSVAASDMLRLAVERVRSAGKKVIVSLNSVGASGAYWIATAADEIFATPSTLTGSIGVFGMTLGFDRLGSAYGVSQDGVQSHDLASPVLFKPMNETQRRLNELSVRATYQHFLNIVTSSRPELKPENYEEFAEGRIFTGREAQKLGLIDHTGDLFEADLELRSLLGIRADEEVEYQHFVPTRRNNLDFLQSLLFTGLKNYLKTSDPALPVLARAREEVNLPLSEGLMALTPLELSYD